MVAGPVRSELVTRERAATDYVRRRVNGLTADTLLPIARVYRDGGQELADRLRRLIDQYGGEAAWPLSAPLPVHLRATRLQSLLQQADILIQRLIAAAQDVVLAATMRAYRMGYWGAAWALDRQLADAVAALSLAEESVRAAALYPYGGLDLTQRFASQRALFGDRVRRAAALSQTAGETAAQATRRLLAALGVAGAAATVAVLGRGLRIAPGAAPPAERGLSPRKHAELVAQTEIQRAAFTGAQALYAQNREALAGWTWLASSGACQVCAPLDGNVYRFGDPSAPTIPRHPRCRCQAGAAPTAYEPTPRQTYRQWAAARGIPEDEDGGLRAQRPLRLERE